MCRTQILLVSVTDVRSLLYSMGSLRRTLICIGVFPGRREQILWLCVLQRPYLPLKSRQLSPSALVNQRHNKGWGYHCSFWFSWKDCGLGILLLISFDVGVGF